ncbi:MAG: hypothetical protein AAGE52_12080 [Myxococcota bacterium]
MAGSSSGISRTLAALRRRATLVHGLRAAAFAAAAGTTVFLVASLLAPPVIGIGATIGWVLIGIATVGALGVGLRPLLRLRGVRIASLLRRKDPRLASMARSALELAQAPSGAPSLVAAHLQHVEQTLAEVPAKEVLPWRPHWRSPMIALVLAGLAASVFAFSDRARTGAFAMLHPGARDDGFLLAHVASGVKAEVRFPAYMNRDAETITSPLLELPKGATVVWSMRPAIDILDATLHTPGQRVRLREADGRFSGRFVVRESGALLLHVRDADGRDLRDASARSLRAVEDEVPQISLVEPDADRTVELRDNIPIRYEAQDDVGLGMITLVVEGAGETVRRTLETLDGDVRYEGGTQVSPVELGARPGDTLRVTIEATDRDDVSGPNVGASPARTLVVASEATRRARSIAELEDVLNAALDALADRLEAPVEESAEEEARARFAAVKGSATRYVDGLDRLAEHIATLDPSVLREMSRRLRRGVTREERLHGRRLGPLAQRKRVDETLVERLEGDVLTLADLVGRARLDDAAAIARELESLRREMTSMLAELRRTDSEEARRALLAAIRRAQARMQELSSRLAAMQEDVPQEFINTEALETEATEGTLDALAEAIERGDLDAAERHLMELERDIDQLARAFNGAGESFAEARFGPRERAMAEAMDTLAGLETEERQLAERSEATRREVEERALEAAGGEAQAAARGLRAQARDARETLDDMPGGAMGPMDQETYDRTRQRLVDAEEALESGDLGEAQRMIEAAHADATQLRRDLELSALMFPGRNNQVADAAAVARQTEDQIDTLQRGLEDAIPRLSDFVRQQQRSQLRQDAPRQGRAAEAAQRLAEQFRAEPDGAPLSPDGARSVEASREAMQRAQQALERGAPMDAARAQQEAAQHLSELRERLEQQQQQQQSGGEGGGGEGGGSTSPQNRVDIPAAEARRDSLRRELLDAMRDGAPRGYEDSVRRYYEELLR